MRCANLTLNLKHMAVTKAVVVQLESWNNDMAVDAQFYDGTSNLCVYEYNIEMTDTTQYTSFAAIQAYANSLILVKAASQGYTSLTSSSQIVWAETQIIPAALIQGASHSIVTGTGATGFQISATRNAFASYSVTATTTATIGGNSSGTVVLEVAPTNSATASDWVEIARFTNGQAISLAVALQSVQTLAGQLNGMVPAGYYAKIRSINNSGTPTYAYNSGQEVLQ